MHTSHGLLNTGKTCRTPTFLKSATIPGRTDTFAPPATDGGYVVRSL